MAESMNALARRGLVSSNAVLRATKVQKSKMAPFHSRQKDEGEAHGLGHANFRVDQINHKATQADRAKSAPSRNKGNLGGGAVGSAARSSAPQGGHVGASYVPGRKQIDEFPRGIGKTFPKGAGFVGKGAAGKNTRMKGPIAKTGGPAGGGRNYYGGGNRNPPEGG